MVETEVLSKDEYCARFKAEMQRLKGAYMSADEISAYVDGAAPNYFFEYEQNPDDPDTIPEASAKIDIGYWED